MVWCGTQLTSLQLRLDVYHFRRSLHKQAAQSLFGRFPISPCVTSCVDHGLLLLDNDYATMLEHFRFLSPSYIYMPFSYLAAFAL